MEICESFKPIARPFLGASSKFFNELSRKIARSTGDFELQPLAPRF
jgi:hypothetical protein